MRTFDSPLSEEITSHYLSKKFMMPNFECYSRETDLIQHLHQHQDKMVIHSHDDLFLSHVIPSSLKGCCLGSVLYALEIIFLKFRGGEVRFLPPVPFLMGTKEEQQRPPHHQNESWGKPQTICQLFSERKNFAV